MPEGDAVCVVVSDMDRVYEAVVEDVPVCDGVMEGVSVADAVMLAVLLPLGVPVLVTVTELDCDGEAERLTLAVDVTVADHEMERVPEAVTDRVPLTLALSD
ncbi:MAG: hypothetical protein P4L40_04300 [Terracidiphilus sp.]|nr:hypothetical protein [Terracidiphilus sp.]